MKDSKNNVKMKFWWIMSPCRIEFFFYYNIEEREEEDIANKLLGDAWLN